jgi:hemolysin D
MKVVKNIVRFPDRRERRRDDVTAFLPAALEVVETPPSPIGRAISATIIALFCAALAWTSLGMVDMVATAPGKIVPGGRSKVIQPFETGVVRAIHVRDGTAVKAGDVLIELDPTLSAAEVEQARSDLTATELDMARMRAMLAAPADPLEAFEPPAGASRRLIELHRQFLVTQASEHSAKLGEVERQLAQKEAERETISAAIAKLAAIIPPLQERLDVRKQLYDKQLGSKIAYLTDFQDLVTHQHEFLVQQSRRREADAAIAALTETRSKVIAEFRRTLFNDLAKAEQRTAVIAQDVIKAERKAGLRSLTAPIDGVVQQLAVHTIGGVVTPAQALAVVVSREGDLEIEALVANRDIGFVFPGQDAEIKVDTFNFTRYGLLHGRVVSVSHDAIVRDKREERVRDPALGAESTTSEPKGQELVYAARVALDRTQMQIESRWVQLSPGMAVTVEIKTGSRRIISYLLSPLVRYKQEVLRER